MEFSHVPLWTRDVNLTCQFDYIWSQFQSRILSHTQLYGKLGVCCRGKARGTSGGRDSCNCPSSKLPHAPDHVTSASPQDGHISSSCPRSTCPNTSNAMSSPCSPISRLIPRVSRRRTRCDGRGGGSSRAGARWMSSTRDAQTKRPKTAIFFPGTELHHVHVVSAMAD